jgi:hypothetical protein
MKKILCVSVLALALNCVGVVAQAHWLKSTLKCSGAFSTQDEDIYLGRGTRGTEVYITLSLRAADIREAKRSYSELVNTLVALNPAVASVVKNPLEFVSQDLLIELHRLTLLAHKALQKLSAAVRPSSGSGQQLQQSSVFQVAGPRGSAGFLQRMPNSYDSKLSLFVQQQYKRDKLVRLRESLDLARLERTLWQMDEGRAYLKGPSVEAASSRARREAITDHEVEILILTEERIQQQQDGGF